jgi:hypothetical protein
LRLARESRRLTLEAAATLTNDRFTADELGAAEAGRRPLSDAEVGLLCRLYGLDAGRLMPRRARLVIDLHNRNLTVGPATVGLSRRVSLTDAVLTRYLALIYRFRGVTAGVPIRLRRLDLETLAESLHLPIHDVEQRLIRLMHEEVEAIGRRSRMFGRRLVVPSAGVLVAVTETGSLVLEQTEEAPPPLPEPRRPPQLQLRAQPNNDAAVSGVAPWQGYSGQAALRGNDGTRSVGTPEGAAGQEAPGRPDPRAGSPAGTQEGER